MGVGCPTLQNFWVGYIIVEGELYGYFSYNASFLVQNFVSDNSRAHADVRTLLKFVDVRI